MARAIADSELPIVSAVGHEIDFSIADLVADQRAATPSAAAELLSPDQQEWLQRLQETETKLAGLIRRRLRDANTELAHLRKRLKHPGHLLREQSQRLDELEQRLILAQGNLLQRKQAELALLRSRLRAASPLSRITQLQSETGHLQRRLESAVNQQLQQARERLAHLAEVLDSLSPLATLKRGYAIVTDGEGRVVSDAGAVKPGDRVDARLAQGRLGLVVETVSKVEE